MYKLIYILKGAICFLVISKLTVWVKAIIIIVYLPDVKQLRRRSFVTESDYYTKSLTYTSLKL